MVALADYASDERTVRVMLSMMAEPADRTVGRLLRREGAVETLRLLDTGRSMTRTRPPSNQPGPSRRAWRPAPGHTTKVPCPAMMRGKVRTFNFTWNQGDSNSQPPACKAGALPVTP